MSERSMDAEASCATGSGALATPTQPPGTVACTSLTALVHALVQASTVARRDCHSLQAQFDLGCWLCCHGFCWATDLLTTLATSRLAGQPSSHFCKICLGRPTC